MAKIKIIISWDGIKRELEMTLKNHHHGNFKRWGLKPILPPRRSRESYINAAKRYYQESDRKNKIQSIIPEMEAWWDREGYLLSKKASEITRISEPSIYYVILTPFGPGGGYNKLANTVFIRITSLDNSDWWKKVIIHEVAHILNGSKLQKVHKENERKINEIVRKLQTK